MFLHTNQITIHLFLSNFYFHFITDDIADTTTTLQRLPPNLSLPYEIFPNYRAGELMSGHSALAWTWSEDGPPVISNASYSKRCKFNIFFKHPIECCVASQSNSILHQNFKLCSFE